MADREDFPPFPSRVPLRMRPLCLEPDALEDATVVAAEGQQLVRDGIPYVVAGMVPALGMLGMHVGYSKVGKTTFSQQLAAAVASGRPFLSRPTQPRRVLYIAAEDPPEYTAYLARTLAVPPGTFTFYRKPVVLDTAGLRAIAGTVTEGGYGLVMIASWQAVVRGLLRDENDNAGSVLVVERVKATTRTTKVPWVIDAHAGKGEDQSDDADPSRAMRGASAASGAADYALSLRYADGPFTSRRRLSGKGRFVDFAPVVIDYDGTGYTALGTTKAAAIETTWRLIVETGALTTTFRTAAEIAQAAGLTADGTAPGSARRHVINALFKRDGIRTTTERRRGQQTTMYALAGTGHE